MRYMILSALLLAGAPAEAGCIGTGRFVAHEVSVAADVLSTRRCVRAEKCIEGNPPQRLLFGRRPSDAGFVGMAAFDTGLYVGGSLAVCAVFGEDSWQKDVLQFGLIGTHGVAAGLNLRF